MDDWIKLCQHLSTHSPPETQTKVTLFKAEAGGMSGQLPVRYFPVAQEHPTQTVQQASFGDGCGFGILEHSLWRFHCVHSCWFSLWGPRWSSNSTGQDLEELGLLLLLLVGVVLLFARVLSFDVYCGSTDCLNSPRNHTVAGTGLVHSRSWLDSLTQWRWSRDRLGVGNASEDGGEL